MLIREGATLIQSAEDILEMIRHFDDRAEPAACGSEFRADRDYPALYGNGLTEMDNAEREPVIALLSMTPVTVDELVRQSGLDAPAVQLALLELELAGRLIRHAGARVSLSN